MAETCVKCGRYIGFWNLRYDMDIECSRCLMRGLDPVNPVQPRLAVRLSDCPELKRKPRRRGERTTLSNA